MSRLRSTITAISILMLAAGCGDNVTNGLDGEDGKDGESCTATDNGDGTFTLDCGGDIIVVSDGTDGEDGEDGQSCTATDNGDGTYTLDCNGTIIVVSDGTDIVSTRLYKNLDVVVTQVRNNAGALAVTFTVKDNGNPVTNLTMGPIRMMVNQFEPSGNTYDLNIWSQDYLYERSATTGADSRFVQGPLGTYTYTFLETIQDAITNDGADAALNQQFAMRIAGFEDYHSVNAIYQFTGLPTTAGAVATPVAAPVGNIVETSACESCHGPGLGNVGHGGGYNKVEYCRNCHTRDDPARLANGTDFMTMIHQIHSSYDHTQGGTTGGHDFSEITYPGDMRNCTKCHKGVDGPNFKAKPNAESCTTCHTDVGLSTGGGGLNGVGHSLGAKTNAECKTCHTESYILQKHATDNATPNNPELPLGAATFEYKINSVTVASDVATVNFAILKDGTAITDLNTTFPPTGFTGGPAFKLAYALPQDGISSPADWNNLGTFQSQPLSVNVSSVIASATPGTAAGTFDVVLSGTPFPAGAKMRAVGIDGYFTQTAGLDPVGSTLARHAPSVVKEVSGDSKRRAIIKFEGCVDCHERLELHGGSRVLAAETAATDAAICLACHNPNLSSSGNTFNIATYVPGSNASSDATIAMFGGDPFAWPEAAQNFKDLVHGIHGSEVRSSPFEHVRMRSGNAYAYDWSEVTFPGDPTNCSKCHVGNSFMPENVPAAALMTTHVTGTPLDRTAALAVRNTLPNADDQVTRPEVAACYGCHNSAVEMAHMNQNGAMLGADRSTVLVAAPATCDLCHDSGSTADISRLHPGLNY